MSKRHDRWNFWEHTLKRILISFELSGDGLERRFYSLTLWLCYHDAVQVGTQWYLITSLTADNVRGELQTLIGPSDRLSVTRVSMSFRIPINADRLGSTP